MSKIKNNSGSALLWTIMTLGLLVVFVTTVLTVAMAYSRRNLNQNQNQQAYYTALSAVELVAKQFSGVHAPDSPQQKIIDQLDSGKEFTTTIENLPPEMGSCKVTMRMRPGGPIIGDIAITAVAEKNGMTYRLSGILRGDVTIIHPDDTPGYGGDDTPAIGAGDVGGGGTGMLTDPDSPIYIWKPDSEFELDTDSDSNDAIHMAPIYTKGDVDVESEKYEYTHLHGEIISDGNVDISENATAGLLTGELLPVGKTECCDNDKPSFIYAMGTVKIEESGVMGGNITATSIAIQNNARVHGNLEAGTVTIDCDWGGDNKNVVGDIRANTVIINSQSTIEGNIIANRVEINGQPEITGTITAQTVVINANKAKDSCTNIIANSLVMSAQSQIVGNVTTAALTMKDNAKIVGAVVTDVISISTNNTAIVGSLDYYKHLTGVNLNVNGTVTHLTVQPPAPVTDSVVNIPAVNLPIPSHLPPKPAAPVYPPKPDDAGPVWGDSTVFVGDSDKDCFYTVNKDIRFGELRVHGTGRIFIYVEDGESCTFNRMIGANEEHPNVFFILGKNSKLLLNRNEYKEKANFYLFVWSREGSGATFYVDRNRIIYGGIWVDNVESDMDNEFHWLAPPDISDLMKPDPPDSSSGSGGEEPEPGDEVIINWGLAAYENR